jgi:hypothetical protein
MVDDNFSMEQFKRSIMGILFLLIIVGSCSFILSNYDLRLYNKCGIFVESSFSKQYITSRKTFTIRVPQT